MKRIKVLVLWLVAFFERYPWTMALFGFVSGVASFFLVEREQEKFAQILSLLMLASWIWLTLEKLLHRSVTQWFGFKMPQPILKFATQMVHQESLFFVIPFFFITTSWNSGQLVFTSLLMIAAFISILDPVYYGWLAKRRSLYFMFHGITLFAVLLTALPIILHIPTSQSYLWSLVIATLLSFLNVVRDLPFNWWKRSLVAVGLIGLTGIMGVIARPWVPPATLWLTQVAITTHIDNEDRSPTNELKIVSVEQLAQGLYAYTAIHAPRGLNERIFHEWRLNGKVVDRIALDINGGRDAGYRAWSHKMKFPPYPSGRWQIRVITEANQVIGVLRFVAVKELSEMPPEIQDPQDSSQSTSEAVVNPASVIREPIAELIEEEASVLLEDSSSASETQSSETQSSEAATSDGSLDQEQTEEQSNKEQADQAGKEQVNTEQIKKEQQNNAQLNTEQSSSVQSSTISSSSEDDFPPGQDVRQEQTPSHASSSAQLIVSKPPSSDTKTSAPFTSSSAVNKSMKNSDEAAESLSSKSESSISESLPAEESNNENDNSAETE